MGACAEELARQLISRWSSCGRRRLERSGNRRRGNIRLCISRTAAAPGFSVRRALADKQVMLIGVTGFIGKVWLANTLMELPKIGRIYLLVRRQKSNPGSGGLKRWWKNRRYSILCLKSTELDLGSI